jgi:hypothetical protein
MEHAKLCMQICNTWWTLALEVGTPDDESSETFKALKPMRRLNLSRQCDDSSLCDD